MKKRIIAFCMVFCLLLSMLPMSVLAVETKSTETADIQSAAEASDAALDLAAFAADGMCGEEAYWVLDEEGVLSINGSGNMDDYTLEEPTPWNGYKESITKVIIGDDISAIGAYAFYGLIKLAEVEFSDSLLAIGEAAFCNCEALAEVQLPEGCTSIGENAFAGTLWINDHDQAETPDKSDNELREADTESNEIEQAPVEEADESDQNDTIGDDADEENTLPSKADDNEGVVPDSNEEAAEAEQTAPKDGDSSEELAAPEDTANTEGDDANTEDPMASVSLAEASEEVLLSTEPVGVEESDYVMLCEEGSYYYAWGYGFPVDPTPATPTPVDPTPDDPEMPRDPWEIAVEEFSVVQVECDENSYTYSYNSAGRINKVVWATDYSTFTYIYDSAGRLTKEEDRETLSSGSVRTTTTTYTYDSAGRLYKVTHYSYDGSISTEYYTYDSAGRLARKEYYYSDGTSSVASYTYDNSGRLTKEVDSNSYSSTSTSTYTYDSTGRLTKEAFSRDSYWSTSTYTYDSAGRLTKSEYSNNDGNSETITYTYNSAGRLAKKTDISDLGQRTFTYTYDSAGRFTKEERYLSWYNDTYSYVFTYDSAGRLTKDRTHTYTYDSAGRLKVVVITGKYITDRITYSYDNIGRPVSRKVASKANDVEDFSSSYEHTFVYNDIVKDEMTVNTSPYKGVYDGEYHSMSLTVSGSNNYTIYYSTSKALTASTYATAGSTTAPTRKNAGCTTVYYYIKDKTGNYLDASGHTYIYIKPKVTATAYNGAYDGKAHSATVKASGSATVYYSTTTALTASNYTAGSTTVPGRTSCGTTTVYYIAVPNSGVVNNNVVKSGSTTITIKKALTVNASDYKGVYDGTAHSISISVSGSSNYTIYYSTSKALTASNYSSVGSTTAPTRKTAGRVLVYYYVKDKTGTCGDVSGHNYIYIKPKVTATAYNGIYDGKAHSPVVKAYGSATVYYSTTTALTASNYTVGSTTVPSRASYGTTTVYYVAVPNSGTVNNNVVKSGSTTITIKKALTVNASDYKGTYDGVSHGISISVSGSSNYTIYYSTTKALNASNYASVGSTTAPTRKTAGRVLVYYYVKDKTGTCGDVSGHNYIYIKPKVTATAYSGKYDGQPHSPVVKANGSATVYYSTTTALTASNYTTAGSTTVPARLQIGTTTVYYIAVPNSGVVNNNVVKAGSTTIRITPARSVSLTPGVQATADITTGGAYSYFTFKPTTTASYSFYSTGSSDSYGYLYDADLNQLTSNDDGGENRNFKITYTLEAGVKYYFGVRYYSNSTTGTIPVILVKN